MPVVLTKILTFFKSSKIITFSDRNPTNFNDNFKDYFVRQKVNKIASKAKTLNDELILSRKLWSSWYNSKFLSTLIVFILLFASFAFFHHLYTIGSVLKLLFDDFFHIAFGYIISL